MQWQRCGARFDAMPENLAENLKPFLYDQACKVKSRLTLD